MSQKPVGQTPECKDSEVAKGTSYSKTRNSNSQKIQKPNPRNQVNINKYPMENQAEPTQYFYLIQCQGNIAIVCTLSLLSATVVNLASDASLKNFCKS